ncbi:MAG: formate dehydrogenase accessory sulfurtransferase FdhD [Anaerolineae bacterium]|nr:formate dehydrogenase accessory sulfurtransferase FdhD [Anaerolineae bacterium]
MSETDASTSTPHPGLIWPIQRIRHGECETTDDFVILEEPLEIAINGRRVAVLMRMPGQEKELAAGFCISEGYVRRADDLLLIHHCGLGHPAPGQEDDINEAASRNRVEVQATEDGFSPPDHPDVVRLIRSGCGAAEVTAMSETLPYLTQNVTVNADVLIGLDRSMRELQAIHHQVGGTHAAALFDASGQVVVLAEDIGRHNAVDKVLGHCLLWRIPLGDKMLLTSGRASYEMAVKAIRTGVAIVASVSAPTLLAVQLAQNCGLTLIGYLRGGRMNVYTHGQRVIGTCTSSS